MLPTVRFRHALLALACATATTAWSAPDQRIATLAAQEKQPFLQTLSQFVGIETGSRDREGLDKLAALIADRFKSLGGEVRIIEPGSPESPEVYRMEDTPEKIGPMVRATSRGTGTRRSC